MSPSATLWQRHLGPFLDEPTAREIILRAGAPADRLLVLTTGSGQRVCPAFQLERGRVLEGLPDVLDLLPEELVSPWSVASWLVSEQVALGGLAPLTALRAGATTSVLAAASSWARNLRA